MNIFYLSSCCSDEKFGELLEKGITKKLPQAQKYHRLLIEGLAANVDGLVYCLSAIPVNRQWTKQVQFERQQELYDNIQFIYDSFINLPFLRQLTRMRSTQREIERIYNAEKRFIIICDVLNQSLSYIARKMGKKYGLLVIGIVTDVPGHTSGARRKSYSFLKRKLYELAERVSEKNVTKYDAYLLLTQAMNEVVNSRGKPYIVLEGHCDEKMRHIENNRMLKRKPKVAMYAGGIHKEFGIEQLVNAFIKGNFSDWELHIYGDGNFQESLTELAERTPNLKYFGAQPNSIITQKQLEATVLLNPRLTDAEYVKYSFPSKTLECMVSGTPLLTTRLPGMPKEYYDYVYLFNDETENGFLSALKTVLSKSENELYEMGIQARIFALEEKNNIRQASRLVSFANAVIDNKDAGKTNGDM